MPTRSIVVAALIALLAGCATTGTIEEPPRVSLVSIAPEEFQLFEQRYRVTLRVLNPNDAQLTIRGISHITAKAGEVVIWTGRFASVSTMPRTPFSITENPDARSRASSFPASVSLTPRPSRTTRVVPSRASSERTLSLIHI